ncbi:GSCOCG00005462001-RA-CDS, partial [Cotesia congregata]
IQHSTIHAINKLLSDVTSHLDENLVGATLIDLEKALDTVWLYGLIYILIKNNFPEHLTSTIWSMISNRFFHTWDGKIKSSKLFNIQEELQQGTVNSPTLLNIFTSHILNACKLNQNNNTFSIAYADDLIIYVAVKCPKELKEQLETKKQNQ